MQLVPPSSSSATSLAIFFESMSNMNAQVMNEISISSVDYNWIVAVLLATLAAFISNLGITLHKLAHIRSARTRTRTHTHTHTLTRIRSQNSKSGSPRLGSISYVDNSNNNNNSNNSNSNNSNDNNLNGNVDVPGASVRSDGYCSSLWLSGLFLLMLGAFADFAALRFGPQSLVAPLGALTLVSNLIFAPLLLKEKIVTLDIVATALIIVGSTICVVFASHDDSIYGAPALFALFTRLQFVIYVSVVAAALTTLLALLFYIESWETVSLSGTSNSVSANASYRSWVSVQRYIYPCISGAIGAFSVLFAKCFVELIVDSVNTPFLVFHDGRTYAILIAMCVTIGLQIKWINDGLKRFHASFIVPVFTANWISLSVVSGLVFFDEYIGMSLAAMLMFSFGWCVTLSGVIMLGTIHHDDDEKMNGQRVDFYDGEKFDVVVEHEHEQEESESANELRDS